MKYIFIALFSTFLFGESCDRREIKKEVVESIENVERQLKTLIGNTEASNTRFDKHVARKQIQENFLQGKVSILESKYRQKEKKHEKTVEYLKSLIEKGEKFDMNITFDIHKKTMVFDIFDPTSIKGSVKITQEYSRCIKGSNICYKDATLKNLTFTGEIEDCIVESTFLTIEDALEIKGSKEELLHLASFIMPKK
jgi:chaperonin cofactor prefoldin